MTFSGFPERLITFYEGLEADNSKAYWSDHRDVYDADVATPMRALLDDLEAEFGPAKFFRPYRDVRFSKDKHPYKIQAAAATGDVGGPGGQMCYVQVSAEGLFLAAGYYRTAADQVERLRAAVGNPRAGAALERVLTKARSAGMEVGGDTLKNVPRGFDREHPRGVLLRHRTLTISRRFEPEPWLHERRCLDIVRDTWRAFAPVNDWLDRHVGPSRLPARPKGGR